jgi:hypothetical protein
MILLGVIALWIRWMTRTIHRFHTNFWCDSRDQHRILSSGFNTELSWKNWVPVLACFRIWPCKPTLVASKRTSPTQLSRFQSLGSSTGFGLRRLSDEARVYHLNHPEYHFLINFVNVLEYVSRIATSWDLMSWGCHRAFSFLLACKKNNRKFQN